MNKLLNWFWYRALAEVVMFGTDWRNFGNEYDHLLRVAARGEVALMRLQDGRWVGVAAWKGRRVA